MASKDSSTPVEKMFSKTLKDKFKWARAAVLPAALTLLVLTRAYLPRSTHRLW